MRTVPEGIWFELLKARRSPVPLFTALGLALLPLAGGFFMIVMRDPEAARRLGIVSAKAQIVAGAADWETYLGILAQGTALGGFMVFAIITSWVYGREYADHTVKDLLALPTSRGVIVASKFILIALWGAALIVWVYGLGLVIGALVGLPPASMQVFWQGTGTLAATAALTILLVTPIAFAASAGHGYLPPMGFAVLLIVLAQVIAAAGWGEYFPWSIPALSTGMAVPEAAAMGTVSYLIVAAVGLVGMIGTFVWWEYADQIH